MKITQSDVTLAAEHQHQYTRTESERLDLVRASADGGQQRLSIEQHSGVSLSSQALALSRQVQQQDPALNQRFDNPARGGLPPGLAKKIEPPVDAGNPLAQFSADSKTLLIKSIVEQFLGRRMELIDARSMEASASAPDVAVEQPATSPSAAQGEAFGMRYERVERVQESESLAVQAGVQVTTEDGRTINLNLNLSMSRQFASESRVLIEAGAKLKDPLVVNLGGGGTRLSDERIDFDLDADGKQDSIAFVAPDSALLALDRNGDGVINDGSELFGALSGNGFADLATYDDDGNGFIDEGDAVFSDLRLWLRSDGENRLLALADQGIGALYLGYTDSPFSLTDEQNQLEGVIRSTGVYLNEDGSGGTLQQIDLVT
ncbi:hypothetical protein [Motiliproteus sediminis]|uniref:hypothetical protein n=1 Tax=Motiliproteus sediminis TaxID=1468178 RepID=UPI001AEFCD4D|nr:hypothetical protein [Motiliproteus sediminis]